MTADPSKLATGSMFNNLLNYDDANKTASFESASIAAGHFKHYSTSVSIDNNKDFSQTQIKYSFDSSRYYVVPVGQLTLNNNFSLTTLVSYDNSKLNIDFYAVNQTGSTHTQPAFTVTIRPYLFAEPV